MLNGLERGNGVHSARPKNYPFLVVISAVSSVINTNLRLCRNQTLQIFSWNFYSLSVVGEQDYSLDVDLGV